MSSKESKYIPKLYRRQTIDIMWFGFINGVLMAMPSMSIKGCFTLFQDRFGVTEDEMPLEAARSTYYRMLQELESVCGKKQQYGN